MDCSKGNCYVILAACFHGWLRANVVVHAAPGMEWIYHEYRCRHGWNILIMKF